MEHDDVKWYRVEWTTKWDDGVNYDQTIERVHRDDCHFLHTGGSWAVKYYWECIGVDEDQKEFWHESLDYFRTIAAGSFRWTKPRVTKPADLIEAEDIGLGDNVAAFTPEVLSAERTYTYRCPADR